MSARSSSIAALFALGLAVACSKSAPPPNVLFISVDTLRADHLGCYGYSRPTSPNIDAFARSGALFTNAATEKGSTWPSLTSIHTGEYPITHGVRRNGDMLAPSHLTIAEMLHARGFRTLAALSNMSDAPNRGFDVKHLTDRAGGSQAEWDDDAARFTAKWIKDLQGEQPFFAWVHFMEPHKPYKAPPPYDKVFDPDYRGPIVGNDELDRYTLEGVQPSPADLAHVFALYDGQIQDTDRRVGDVLRALDESGRAANTLVVFFSDHGEELFDHQHYAYHSCSMYDGVMRIALAMRWPGHVAPKTIDWQVEEIDLAPTVFDLLDLPRPATFEGESLTGLVDGKTPRKKSVAFMEYAEREPEKVLAIRDGRWKLILDPTGFQPRNPPYSWSKPKGFAYEPRELYDLAKDPGERTNLAASDPTETARLEQELTAWFEEHEKHRGQAGEMDERTREKMKALGYIGADEK